MVLSVGFSAHVKPTNPEIMNPTVDLHLVQRKRLPLWGLKLTSGGFVVCPPALVEKNAAVIQFLPCQQELWGLLS